MKLFLCGVIVLLSAYIGRLLSKRTAQRLEFLREFQSSMVHLFDDIIGINLPIYDALKQSYDQKVFALFYKCSKQIKQTPQKRFAAIWRECCDVERANNSFLTKEDERILITAGESIDTLCKNPSEKQASIYLKRLGEYIAHMESEKRKKSKLFNTAGVLTGLFIALLVI